MRVLVSLLAVVTALQSWRPRKVENYKYFLGEIRLKEITDEKKLEALLKHVSPQSPKLRWKQIMRKISLMKLGGKDIAFKNAIKNVFANAVGKRIDLKTVRVIRRCDMGIDPEQQESNFNQACYDAIFVRSKKRNKKFVMFKQNLGPITGLTFGEFFKEAKLNEYKVAVNPFANKCWIYNKVTQDCGGVMSGIIGEYYPLEKDGTFKVSGENGTRSYKFIPDEFPSLEKFFDVAEKGKVFVSAKSVVSAATAKSVSCATRNCSVLS